MKIFLPVLVVLALPACTDSLGLMLSGDAGSETSSIDDADHDTISDEDEGRSEGVDTDGDGVPDWQDLDSDGDGILDLVEAGDDDHATPPLDCDGDGFPNYRDRDSDDNGILDMHEGTLDRDGDGLLDYCDPDNDGDFMEDVEEIGGNPATPVDFDGDGRMDLNDIDSDNDTITDQQERPARSDVDEDLLPDRHDLDTDGDGIQDSVEAGDSDLATWPRDTDDDGVPDFRDLDSDNDGLSDSYENEIGDCNPYDPDSDGDGIPDLIEIGAGCDGCTGYPERCGPRHEGNFVFIMHYEDDPDPLMDHIVFASDIQMADVFFAFDSGSSMSGEIGNLRDSLATVVVPGLLAVIPNVWFGVGRFEDCTSCEHNMSMLQAMTDDIPAVEAALTGWETCGGNEPYTHYLYALASGDVAPFVGWGGVSPETWTCTPPGTVGWPCFREGALPVVVQFGDSAFEDSLGTCSPARGIDDAIAALNSINARYVGVNSGPSTGQCHADMTRMAEGTGSIDASGTALVFDISTSGTGLGAQVVDAIEILANQVPVELTVVLRDDLSDLVDTVAEFVDRVEANVEGGYPDPGDPTIICVGGLEVDDDAEPFDGRPDTFTSVLPGTPVCFDIHAKQNRTVPATEDPQTFLLQIDVVANGLTVVDTRNVYFVVPPSAWHEVPD